MLSLNAPRLPFVRLKGGNYHHLLSEGQAVILFQSQTSSALSGGPHVSLAVNEGNTQS